MPKVFGFPLGNASLIISSDDISTIDLVLKISASVSFPIDFLHEVIPAAWSFAKVSSNSFVQTISNPACSFYSNWLTTNFEAVNDLFGTIEKVIQFSNDTLGLQLQTLGKEVLINGLINVSKKDFESLIGKNVILYNLKKTKQSLNATANNFTTIYE